MAVLEQELRYWYGYVRISKDEDNSKKDSIETQIKILEDYAKTKNICLAHVFKDDNFTGYKFDRPDFNKLKNLIEEGRVEGILVKDLSRVGRHNAQALLFLDYLKEKNVKLIAVTENINTSNENDDMLIGIKTWYNELYIKDISRKIRTQIRQKMKEGLVIVPQFGYMKDPHDPKKYIIDEEAGRIIKEIFRLYTEEGLGFRKIAEHLNEKNIITPSLYKREKFNRVNAKTDPSYEHLWYETSVKRILTNDVYIGTLRCGTTQRTMIKGGRRYTDESEHIVHENFFPPIISKETFELTQKILKQRKSNNVRAKNEKIHRYAGLLICGDCERVFVAKKRSSSKGKYIDYVCSTYHRYGKEYCTPHRIKETDLDDIINEHLLELKKKAIENLKRVDEFILNYNNQKRSYDNSIDKVKLQLNQLKEEIKGYSKQLAKSLITEEEFVELTKEARQHQERLTQQLSSVQELQIINEQSKEGVLKSVDVLEEMITKGKITSKDIRLLIDKIIIKNTEELNAYGNPKVAIEIQWATPFKYHEIQSPCGDVISLISVFNQYLDKLKIA